MPVTKWSITTAGQMGGWPLGMLGKREDACPQGQSSKLLVPFEGRLLQITKEAPNSSPGPPPGAINLIHGCHWALWLESMLKIIEQGTGAGYYPAGRGRREQRLSAEGTFCFLILPLLSIPFAPLHLSGGRNPPPTPPPPHSLICQGERNSHEEGK